ncbi:hypothetical protein AMTRI_Chr09g32210 [Amborella trichopoda]
MVEDGISFEPSEELRCKRSDGKSWRCRNWRIESKSYCQEHYLATLKQFSSKKKGKRKRKARAQKENGAANSPSSSMKKRRGEGDLMQNGAENSLSRKRSTESDESSEEVMETDDLRRAKKKPKKKQGGDNDMPFRAEKRPSLNQKMALRKRKKTKMKEEEEEESECEKLAEPSSRRSNHKNSGPKNEGGSSHIEPKMEFAALSYSRRKTRSQNKEQCPVKIPQRKPNPYSNMCHQCQRNDNGRVVRCTKCGRKRYCIPCLTRWYVGLFYLYSISLCLFYFCPFFV